MLDLLNYSMYQLFSISVLHAKINSHGITEFFAKVDFTCILGVSKETKTWLAYAMYIECIFKVTKDGLADARCTRCRSPPAMQLV